MQNVVQLRPYIIFIMRTSLILIAILITLTGVLVAGTVKSQNLDEVKVTLSLKGASLQESLLSLQRKSGIRISFFDEALQKENKKVNITGAITTGQALRQILSGTNLTYRLMQDFIVIDTKPVPRKPGRITGKVLDEKDQPLPGATIKIVETGQAIQSSIDGSYNFGIAPGSYTIEVSYIAYQTKRVTQVEVKEGEATSLNILLNPVVSTLNQVTITSSFKKESVAGLYARQKNAASVTDGISAEQIARTPDNNMGAALKRITGLTTVNNRNVIVRGMSDRYNQAQLDGVSVPSTAMNRRDFSFDIIPAEMVSAVVVNKTATPDVSSEFSGGQVSINTHDIPEQNFINIQIGSGFNSQAIGKDFYQMGERHTSEYFGFSHASAKQPEGILSWNFRNQELPPPGGPGTEGWDLIPGNGIPYNSLDAVAQSRRLSAEPLKMKRYNGAPFQNYRLSLGRVYDLKNNMRFGFSAAASLRNEQQVYQFNNVRGAGNVNPIDSTKYGYNGAGTSYRFNSNSGLAANLGLQGNKFKVTLKNLYARTYSNNYNEAIRINYVDAGYNGTEKPLKEQYQLPEAMSLRQHQLSVEYELPWAIKSTAMVTYNKIEQRIEDERKFKYLLTAQIGGEYYFQTPNIQTPAQTGTDALTQDSRMWTSVNEDDFNWAVSFSKKFGTAKSLSTVLKTGYQGFDKRRNLSVLRMATYAARNSVIEQPYEVALDPENIGTGINQAYYWALPLNGPVFDGVMQSHAVYLMADQKLWNRLRLVYGLRGESFELNNSQEELLKRQYGPNPSEFISFRKGVNESGWRWLPSMNATYELTSNLNLRSSYSRTVIRPDFRESSFFGFYDYELDGNVAGDRVESTMVDNVDMRLELYPGAGEIISITGYYKFLDRPIELVKDMTLQSNYYSFANMESATNLGLELEIRKNLKFLGEQQWLKDVFIYGNGSLLKSKVKTMTGWRAKVIDDAGNSEFVQEKGGDQDRPLIGQSPWLLNLGLGYWGDTFGMTASYNQRGYRTNLVANNENTVEYERAAGQLDGQLYARFFKKKAEIKFSAANLLNQWNIFYRNTELMTGDLEKGWVPFKGDKRYNKDDGDTIMYRRKEGQRFYLSLTYNF